MSKQERTCLPIGKITKKKDFDLLFREGKWRRRDVISVIFKESDDGGSQARVAFIISRKIKGAVKRNKLKRRLREIYRDSEVKKGMDMLIIAHKGAEELNFLELKENVEGAMKGF